MKNKISLNYKADHNEPYTIEFPKTCTDVINEFISDWDLEIEILRGEKIDKGNSWEYRFTCSDEKAERVKKVLLELFKRLQIDTEEGMN